jgi:hypothetical protein
MRFLNPAKQGLKAIGTARIAAESSVLSSGPDNKRNAEAEIDHDTNSPHDHLSFQRAGAPLSAPLDATSSRKPRTATDVTYFDYHAGRRDDVGP